MYPFPKRFKLKTILPILAAGIACWSMISPRQLSAQMPPSLSGPPLDASGHRPGEEPDAAQKEMLAKLETRRNEARQQEIVRDTAKLLALATELKSDVDKTSKNVLSIDVIKKADEIDKLAKTIKERMKD